MCDLKYMVRKTQIIYQNHKYFSSFQKLCQCVIKLQTKIQITQQHNKSKLKNTYRIKKSLSRAKYNSVTSKEDLQKDKLSKQCSKFPSKTLIQSQCLYCQL